MQWKEEIEENLSNLGIEREKCEKIRDIMLGGPIRATFYPLHIARVLFGEEHLSKNMIGPKLCGYREGNRKSYLNNEDEQKLRDVLRIISKSYLEVSEWRVLVRDIINQASRNWLAKNDGFTMRNQAGSSQAQPESASSSTNQAQSTRIELISQQQDARNDASNPSYSDKSEDDSSGKHNSCKNKTAGAKKRGSRGRRKH